MLGLRGALARGARARGWRRPTRCSARPSEHDLLVELDRLCRQPRAPLLRPHPVQRQDLREHAARAPSATRSSGARPSSTSWTAPRSRPTASSSRSRRSWSSTTTTCSARPWPTSPTSGMSFAVDDVGAGYSGLESIARLKPHLPEDRHRAGAGRAREPGQPRDGEGHHRHGPAASAPTVIAEGIHTDEEAQRAPRRWASTGARATSWPAPTGPE